MDQGLSSFSWIDRESCIYMCKGDFIEVRRDWIQLRNCTLYCSTRMDQRLKEKDLKGFLASCRSAGQLWKQMLAS